MLKKGVLIVLLILMTFGFATAACADETPKMSVKVIIDPNSNDMVGQRLIYLINEGIRKSESMRLVYDDNYQLALRITTTDPFPETPNVATIYSIAWTTYNSGSFDYFYAHTVGKGGMNHVDQLADNVVAKTDQIVSELWNLIINYLKNNPNQTNIDNGIQRI
jgi:hypothetical protein